jgi:hypothetical protein
MKVLTILSIACFSFPLFSNGQSIVPQGNASTYVHCTKFYVSKPLRELAKLYPYKPRTGVESADKVRRAARPKAISISKDLQSDYTDPIRQNSVGSVTGSIAPIINFQGMTTTEIPGDPNGAVGPDYYVETINVEYAIYDKSGNTVLPETDLGSLWPGDPRDGDPVALYDKFADRWFLSEFQTSNTPNQFAIAVSKTNDPAGAYYVWLFSMGSTDPDYPKYSIWTDGYYITFQALNASFNPIVPQEVAVLERNRMLKGDPSAGMILTNLPTPPDFTGGNNSLFTAPKTLDCDASVLPPYGTPNYLVYFENIASGGYSNSIVMYKLVTDTNLHTLTVSRADSFAVPTFNAYFNGGSQGLSDISQPGYLHGVDALDGTFNFRVPYGIFTGYNAIVLSNTVNLGGMVAGIRWYELRQNNVTQKWSIYQDGTYGPNDGVSRWNGAICMDYNGDIALAYSVADSVSLYPGIRYTGRLVTDPLGQMTFTEQTAIAGTTSLTGTFNRWGDYSELDIDPSDGLTFWCTNQYGASSNTNQDNRIFSFRLTNTLGIDNVQNQTEVKAYQSGNFLEVDATGLPDNEKLTVDLFDIAGRQLSTQSVAPVSNIFETKINVSTLPKGVYMVRVGRVNFQKVIKVVLN